MKAPDLDVNPRPAERIMGVDRHIHLFDTIARPYSWFHRIEIRKYTTLLRRHLPSIGVFPPLSVLDVGCGPGSFGIALRRQGFSASGVDGSTKMASIAVSNGLECKIADATVGLPYPDNSFDLVTAAYLAHGFTQEYREVLFSEMKRVARRLVLIHDFSPAEKGIPVFTITGLLELLEGSDYVKFRHNAVRELETVFGSVQVFPISRWISWYICRAIAVC